MRNINLYTCYWHMITLRLGSDLIKHVLINTAMFSSRTWNVTHCSRLQAELFAFWTLCVALNRKFDTDFKIIQVFQINRVRKTFVILTFTLTLLDTFITFCSLSSFCPPLTMNTILSSVIHRAWFFRLLRSLSKEDFNIMKYAWNAWENNRVVQTETYQCDKIN